MDISDMYMFAASFLTVLVSDFVIYQCSLKPISGRNIEAVNYLAEQMETTITAENIKSYLDFAVIVVFSALLYFTQYAILKTFIASQLAKGKRGRKRYAMHRGCAHDYIDSVYDHVSDYTSDMSFETSLETDDEDDYDNDDEAEEEKGTGGTRNI